MALLKVHHDNGAENNDCKREGHLFASDDVVYLFILFYFILFLFLFLFYFYFILHAIYFYYCLMITSRKNKCNIK